MQTRDAAPSSEVSARSHASGKRPEPLPQVEVARVLAMSAIFLFHLWSVVPDGVGEWARVALSRGHLGVVVFNMMTGLVLAWPHLGPTRRPLPAWGEFQRRRFLRIVPAYYLTLGVWVAIAAMAAWALAGDRRPPSAASVVAHVLFLHTLSPADFFSIVPAYWWLGLLAQLYFAFPLLLRVGRASGRWLAIVAAACWGGWLLVDAIARARPHSTIALVNYLGYYNLPYRLPEFAFGVGLARLLSSEQGSAAPRLAPATASILLPVCALLALLPRPDSAPLAHFAQVAGCAAVLVALLSLPLAARLGSTPVVRYLAAVSFGFYLMHQPILGYGSDLLTGMLAPRPRFWVLLASAGALTLALTAVLDRLAATVATRLDGTTRS